MPSPVAHSLAAVALAEVARHLRPSFSTLAGGRWRWWLAAAALAAIAPDFDFVPGVLIGRPDWLHRGASHSLGAAAIVAAACWGLARARRVEPAVALSTLMGLAYGSHLLLDMFSPDPLRFNGVPLFWPVSTREVVLPAQLFLEIRRQEGAGFLLSLWQVHNLHAVTRELLIMAPLLLAARLIARAWVAGADAVRNPRLDRRVDSES